MKKLLMFIVLNMLIFSYNSPKVFAESQEQIKSFNENLTVNKDGTLHVTEMISYDFGSNQKHGIYRSIPYIKTNSQGENFKMDFSNVTISNDLSAYPFTTADNGFNVQYKIGSADKLVTGLMYYQIDYTVSGAVTYFSDHDELYWNITGNAWNVPIGESAAIVDFPEGTDLKQVSAICYTGVEGSNGSDCLVEMGDQYIFISLNKSLKANEGLTLAIKFPKGTVAVLEPKKQGTSFWQTVGGILFGLGITLFSIFWYVYYPVRIFIRWAKEKKRTDNLQRIVAAWFSSPKTLDKRSLTPAETSALVDRNVDHKDVSATIIDLAQRGYLKIVAPDANNISFQLLKDFSDDFNVIDFEKEILNGLFDHGKLNTRNLSDLTANESFGTHIKNFKKKAIQRLISEKFYKDDIDKVSTFYSVIGAAALFIGFNFILALSAFFFGRKSSRRTDLGIEKYSEAMSLKNFLVSQNDQLNFQAENQMMFEKLLPYATAFGVEKIWAKRFEGFQLEKTNWYDGDLNNALVFGTLTSTLNNTVSSSMSSTNSSSGFSSGFSGGSSGGGGGGGGGGSW